MRKQSYKVGPMPGLVQMGQRQMLNTKETPTAPSMPAQAFSKALLWSVIHYIN